MGWTVWYEVARKKPLGVREKAALARHHARWAAKEWAAEGYGLAAATSGRADQVLVAGAMKLGPIALESPEVSQLCEALTELVRLIKGGTLRVRDDHDAFGWDSATASVTIGGAATTAPTSDEGSDDSSAWTSLASLVPAKPITAPSALSDDPPTGAGVGKLLRALHAETDPARVVAMRALLARCRGLDVALQGLPLYAHMKAKPAGDEIVAGLRRLTDVAPLEDLLLSLWDRDKGRYYFLDLARALPPACFALPRFEALLTADVASATLHADVGDRRKIAAEHLAFGAAPQSLSVLVAGLRARRFVKSGFGFTESMWHPMLEGFSRRVDAETVPTAVLELDFMRTVGIMRGHRLMVPQLGRADGAISFRMCLWLSSVLPALREEICQALAETDHPLTDDYLDHLVDSKRACFEAVHALWRRAPARGQRAAAGLLRAGVEFSPWQCGRLSAVADVTPPRDLAAWRAWAADVPDPRPIAPWPDDKQPKRVDLFPGHELTSGIDDALRDEMNARELAFLSRHGSR